MIWRKGARTLEASGVPDALKDARKLYEAAYRAGGQAPEPQTRERPNDLTLEMFGIYLGERARRRPVSQILGTRAFWKSEFRVTGDVLDPRPETETLVEIALCGPFSRVLDLGTGSGAILISLLADRPKALGVGTDISAKAVLLAGENAMAHGVADRIVLPISDWWEDVGGTYDLIVSNPPYIAASEMEGLAPEVRDWEPRAALTDEGDGLSAYRKIAPGAFDHLTPGGRLIVEIGPTQGAAVQAVFAAAGFSDIAVHPDLDGRDRVVAGTRAP